MGVPGSNPGRGFTIQGSGKIGVCGTLFYTSDSPPQKLAFLISPLDLTSFYNFVSGTMITLFVVALIVILVYEYEVLRRSKT